MENQRPILGRQFGGRTVSAPPANDPSRSNPSKRYPELVVRPLGRKFEGQEVHSVVAWEGHQAWVGREIFFNGAGRPVMIPDPAAAAPEKAVKQTAKGAKKGKQFPKSRGPTRPPRSMVTLTDEQKREFERHWVRGPGLAVAYIRRLGFKVSQIAGLGERLDASRKAQERAKIEAALLVERREECFKVLTDEALKPGQRL
ncbi:MAG: hypothetical protein L0Z48_12710, partial [candidate division Zixibacteria bacterium]|nr:hypothetical protein [candidate division Zixibacteria bacterium]